MKKGLLIHIIFLLACTSYSRGVATVSEPETLQIQWLYSKTLADRQLDLMISIAG